MAYTNLLPRTVNITGSDCTGSDGTANRTYTLTDLGVLSEGVDITINGTTLLPGAAYDYTLSSTVITFLNIVDDSDIIRINYFIVLATASSSTLSTSTSLKYATPQMLAEILGIKADIPSWDVGSTPSNELVGTGDNTETIFYLDHKNIISDSCTLYYGATASTTDELTETTHYVLNEDTGKITLTSAGVTLLSTNEIYATYSYITNGMSNSYLISVLSRAEKEVDKSTNSTFTDGTTTNPSYPVETEIQPSEGIFMDRVIVKKKPLIDVMNTLNGAITDTDATITLTSATGFPSSGYIAIGNEVISYTGVSTNDLTGCTRGVLGTTALAHDDGDEVHTTLLFRSDTGEGTDESYTFQAWDTAMYADSNGLIYKFNEASPEPLTRQGVANRIKIIYYYGYDTVPGDITRLTLLFAKRMLVQDNISKAMIAGRNEFQPEMFNADLNEINRIIDSYIVLSMGNT